VAKIHGFQRRGPGRYLHIDFCASTGDGVGYYAFVRAPLIEHNLDATGEVPEPTHS